MKKYQNLIKCKNIIYKTLLDSYLYYLLDLMMPVYYEFAMFLPKVLTHLRNPSVVYEYTIRLDIIQKQS
jgi:hypothetical protein